MADTKVTALTENTTPVGTDLVYIVDDPGGTPASQKITVANLAKGMFSDAEGDPAQVSNTAAADGTSNYPARRDHAHLRNAFSGAVLTKSAVQSINNATETAITFDGEVFDTDSYHDNSTNNTRLTAPVTGYYLVGGSAEVASIADGKYVIVFIRKQGTNANGDGRARIFTSTADTYISPHFSRIVALDAGQYVELTVQHNHGSARDVRETTNGTSFWIYRIG